MRKNSTKKKTCQNFSAFPFVIVEDEVEKADDAVKAARESALARFGKGPLPINPATGKRWYGTGKAPRNGNNSPILQRSGNLPSISLEGRFRSRRERAAEMQERMYQFQEIYNAGWAVRNAYFGPDQQSHKMMMLFLAALLRALRTPQDYEALIYAVADTLTASPHGVPWEV